MSARVAARGGAACSWCAPRIDARRHTCWKQEHAFSRYNVASRMKLLAKSKVFWRKLRRRRRLKSVIRVDSRAELPTKPTNLGAAICIVGSDSPKWAVLDCPCRCGERIDVNLMLARRPTWQLVTKQGKVTLQPSLWVTSEKCGSHFWVRENRIIWVWSRYFRNNSYLTRKSQLWAWNYLRAGGRNIRTCLGSPLPAKDQGAGFRRHPFRGPVWSSSSVLS
jgi:Family of unknown function (DUF6527)